MFIESKNLIIIPTRKCGGISISNALKHYMSEDTFELYNLGTMSGHHPRRLEPKHGVWNKSCLTKDIYLIVRNPFDKMVSNYFYSNKGKKIWGVELDFESFVFNVRDKEQPVNWEIHTNTPSLNFVTDNDNIIDHKIIKFEQISKDFNALTSKYNLTASLPHLNKSRKDTGKYREYYNLITRNLVEDMFKDDLNYFNYEF